MYLSWGYYTVLYFNFLTTNSFHFDFFLLSLNISQKIACLFLALFTRILLLLVVLLIIIISTLFFFSVHDNVRILLSNQISAASLKISDTFAIDHDEHHQ